MDTMQCFCTWEEEEGDSGIWINIGNAGKYNFSSGGIVINARANGMNPVEGLQNWLAWPLTCSLPKAPMQTSGGSIMGRAYVPPIWSKRNHFCMQTVVHSYTHTGLSYSGKHKTKKLFGLLLDQNCFKYQDIQYSVAMQSRRQAWWLPVQSICSLLYQLINDTNHVWIYHTSPS